VKKLILLCLAMSAFCLSLASPPQASAAGPVPTCVPFCCDPAVPDTQKCWYNNGYKTCAWFRQPGHSACL
jgi:hypothetical protein